MAHVKSYSDLMLEGFQQALSIWKLRILMFSLAIGCLFFGVMSAIFSALLWAAIPLLNDQNSWLLFMLPLFFLALSWFFYILAKSYKIEPLFNDVQEQLNLDLLAICQASSK
jgi:hypothetical protein